MKLKGFSLIELMIVIAIIGILAAIAIPSYQNYIYRAKTSELISTANAVSTQVSEYIQEQGQSAPDCTKITQPSISATNNVAATTTPITATAGNATSCMITIAPNTAAGKGFAGVANPPTINLTPAVNADGSVSWTCSSSKNPYAPLTCQ